MIRTRFLWKLYGGYVVLIILTAAIVGGLVLRRIERDSIAGVERALRSQAVILARLAALYSARSDLSGLQEMVVKLGRSNTTRYTIIAPDGRVLADSKRDPARMENHRGRPEILQALRVGEGHSKRWSATLHVAMRYVALPVEQGDKVSGFVRTAIPVTRTQERLKDLRALVILGALAGVALALVMGFLFARRITDPLSSITRSAESIAAGQYDQEIAVEARDEIGVLARSFNHMARNLRERIATIEHERQQLVAVLAGMVEGVIALDRDQRIVHMNAAAGRILSLKPEGAIGYPLQEIVRVPLLVETAERVMTKGQGASTELHLSGQPRMELELHAAPLGLRDGAAGGAVLVLHDITELVRLESVRRDFIANVSHELKTPLTAIRGLVETMLDDQHMEALMRQRFLEKTRVQTDRLSTLVRDLLVLSRVESEAGLKEFTSVDLCALARKMISLIQPSAEAKGLKLVLNLPPLPLPVNGDEESLGEMISNLLANAVTYTPTGGRVRLELWRQGEQALVQVSDTGIGMEREHLKRIFERFYRVDKARSRELGGTGLGLSIVKHIAWAHGGRVSVESSPGQGSTFKVELPCEALR